MKKRISLILTILTLSFNVTASDLRKDNIYELNSKKSLYPFVLPELPYAQDALEPYISAKTFSYHYAKHHNAYYSNLNKLIKNTNLTNKSLEEIIIYSYGKKDEVNVFNNAAQAWNHSFFWRSMKVNGGGAPYGEIATLITRDFGSYENFKTEFKKAARTQFGSGWTWIALDNTGKLVIMKTSNADLPMVYNKKAIITLDVWEHAYYLDYQNLRSDYIDVFLQYLINWEFANEMLVQDSI